MRSPAARPGFSLIELLVAVAIAGAVLTTAVMIYQNLAARGVRSSYGRITVGPPLTIFYPGGGVALDAYIAPNYGRAAAAELVRDQFIEDLQSASAVFCLGREAANPVHPSALAIPAGFRGDSLDLPEAFRVRLAASLPAAAPIFLSYRGACPTTNASVFLLIPSDEATSLSVLAVYDLDLTPATSVEGDGTYASVKRYQGGTLTDYYDIFYPKSAQGLLPFKPLVVCFERRACRAKVETVAIDRLKQAAQRPFYFMWWPDPAAARLEAISAPAYVATDPRASYAAMAGRTAFFFVVPMFPAL